MKSLLVDIRLNGNKMTVASSVISEER